MCPARWLDGGSARREIEETWRIMRARNWGAHKLIWRRGRQERERFTELGDERLSGVLSEDEPVCGLNIIVIVRSS